MKRLFLLLTACVAWCAVSLAQPKASFTEMTYDFGNIKEANGAVTHTFEVVNTGNKPLLIIDALASCGCTRPSYTAKPIKPGKKGKVEVTFSPIGRSGSFRKSIKVKTNGEDVTLTITGTIIPKGKD